MNRLLLRIWLAAGTALAWALGALWFDDRQDCGNRDCPRRTHFMKRSDHGLLLCLACGPAEQGARHDHF